MIKISLAHSKTAALNEKKIPLLCLCHRKSVSKRWGRHTERARERQKKSFLPSSSSSSRDDKIAAAGHTHSMYYSDSQSVLEKKQRSGNVNKATNSHNMSMLSVCLSVLPSVLLSVCLSDDHFVIISILSKTCCSLQPERVCLPQPMVLSIAGGKQRQN